MSDNIEPINNLTTGSVAKKLFRFALPILAANLLQGLYGTVDLVIVGQFSPTPEVSAVSTGSQIMLCFTMIIIGLSMGTAILLGHNIGSRDYSKTTQTIASSILIFVITTIAITSVALVFSPQISTLMNAPKEAFDLTVTYVRVCGGGIVFVVFFNMISSMFRGIGDSRTPLILMIIATASNVILDLILVGYFSMGSLGAAIATVAAQGISVFSALIIIKARGLGYSAEKKDFVVSKDQIKLVLKYGLPIALHEFLTGISFMVILSILNSFGVAASVGGGVATKIFSLVFIIPSAVSASLSAFVAQNIGAKEYHRASSSLLYGMIFAASIGLAMYFVCLFKGDFLVSLFVSDGEAIFYGHDYLKSYAVDMFLVGFVFSLMGYLEGCGKTFLVSAITIIATFAVRVPGVYIISLMPGVTLFHLGIAAPIASVVQIIMLFIYYLYVKRRLH